MAKIDKFTEEELREIVSRCCSFRELAREVGYTSIGNNNDTIVSRLQKYNISTEHFTGKAKGVTKRSEENIFILNSTASQQVLRRWYLKGEYTPYICSICGQPPIWNNKDLILILDHINGNNKDDRLENLRWVCPNCNYQLDTTNGKNPYKKESYNKATLVKKYCIDCGIEINKDSVRCHKCNSKSKRISVRPEKDELESLLIKFKGNFSYLGKIFNVTDNTIRKWCKGYNLPYLTSDYNPDKKKRVKKNIDEKEIIDLYNQYHNITKVSEILDICQDTVSDKLKKNNIYILSGQEVNAQKNSKLINQYDLEGNYIRTFSSAQEAEKYLQKINNTTTKYNQHISHVCQGKRKTAYGYIWKFKNEGENK